jgi:LysM repeat protein
MGKLSVDRNERILTSVLRERGQHRRVAGLGSGWLVVGAILLVVGVTVGFQLAVSHRGDRQAAAESSGVDGARSGAATAARPDATVPAGGQARQPAAAVSQPGSRAAGVETQKAASTTAGTMTRYVVQPGDSLQMIASHNHLSPATLASVNDLDDPDVLQPGRELIIPSTDGVVHVVEPGETLRSIADDYGTQTAVLIQANGLSTPDQITVGLRLFIPR